jgi:nitrite reductase/ring-hydroxylating ferredoxin subunit
METREEFMKKIGNLEDIQKGEALYFEYQGKKAILIRTKDDDLVAYSAVCPHEKGDIEWDGSINMLLCECHLSLFNVNDGSVYRHSSVFELDEGLTRIDVTVDENKNIMV